MKKKVITSAILTIALALSLLLGATYALFTSESKTNIAISSGKVDVQAVVLEESIKTYSQGQLQVNGFELGGSVLFEENTLSIEGIMPGDKVEFTIQVKNLSNVAVLYRTILKAAEDNGLFHGLEVTVDGSVYDGSTSISNWIALNNTEVVKEVQVRVELPVGRGNEYQDKSTVIQYTVEAVQGNAAVENPQTDTFYIYTASDLVKFSKEVNNADFKEKIVFMNDIDMDGIEYVSPVVNAQTRLIDGNNNVVRYLNTLPISRSTEPGYGEYGFNSGFIASFAAGSLELKNITFENASFTGADSAGVVSYLNPRGATYVFDNVDVVDSYVSGIKWIGGVYGYATNEAGHGTIIVKNSDVTNLTLEGFDTSMGAITGHISGTDKLTVELENNNVSNITLLGLNPQKQGKMIGTLHLGQVQINNSFVDGVNALEAESFYGRYVKGASSQVFVDEHELISHGMYKGAEATLISNAVGLRTLAIQVNSGTSYAGQMVQLIRNIDLNNEEWTPIGTSTNRFKGHFNGNGNTISNLLINMPNSSEVGLFGVIEQAIIENITLENVNVTGYSKVAAVVGAAPGGNPRLKNIHLTGLIQIKGFSYTGGILGQGYVRLIENNTVNGAANSFIEIDKNYVGGILGFIGESGKATYNVINNAVRNIEIRTTTNGYFENATDTVKTSGTNLGGISGIAQYGTHFTNNTIENVQITHNRDSNHILMADQTYTVGAVVGITVSNAVGITISNNQIINVTLKVAYSTNELTNGGFFGRDRSLRDQYNVTANGNIVTGLKVIN